MLVTPVARKVAVDAYLSSLRCANGNTAAPTATSSASSPAAWARTRQLPTVDRFAPAREALLQALDRLHRPPCPHGTCPPPGARRRIRTGGCWTSGAPPTPTSPGGTNQGLSGPRRPVADVTWLDLSISRPRPRSW